ncbi:uncharacterized protein METZ01_LOCUS26953 [marine metagenome]|uniref:Uncharacterized protein n=1 Tax=marine metagenome TaxID=408172 RepID=A0A381Q6S9_9ZZZZ
MRFESGLVFIKGYQISPITTNPITRPARRYFRRPDRTLSSSLGVIVFSALFSLLGLMILRINKTTPKANKR